MKIYLRRVIVACLRLILLVLWIGVCVCPRSERYDRPTMSQLVPRELHHFPIIQCRSMSVLPVAMVRFGWSRCLRRLSRRHWCCPHSARRVPISKNDKKCYFILFTTVFSFDFTLLLQYKSIWFLISCTSKWPKMDFNRIINILYATKIFCLFCKKINWESATKRRDTTSNVSLCIWIIFYFLKNNKTKQFSL